MALEIAEMNRRLIDLAESPVARFWRLEFEALSAPERVFRAVWELEAQVNNGGFDQYFFNSSGALAPVAVDALRAVGANRTAIILEQAIDVLGKHVEWSDDAFRQTRLSVLAGDAREKLDRLDSVFFSYPDDLTVLLYKYVWTHRMDIAGARDNIIRPS